MTVSNLIHPVKILRGIEKTSSSNKSENSDHHLNHNIIKKQHSKDFGDSMQQALSKDNPVFIEDEDEKLKIKSKLQKNALLNKLSLEYKLNQR